jgi:adenylosuccinate lyase
MAAAARIKDGGETNDLPARIAGDTAFGVTESDVNALLDPARHIGRSPDQVDAFLRDCVQPVLDRYSDTSTLTSELRA